jgi:putative transposase
MSTYELGDIIRYFKTMTTLKYIKSTRSFQWQGFEDRLWQRNYFEHIIKDKDELLDIRRYILDNPSNYKEITQEDF